MKNLQDSETRFTVGDNGTLTVTKCGNWHGHQKCDRIIHCVKFSDIDVIKDLHTNLSGVMRALKRVSE